MRTSPLNFTAHFAATAIAIFAATQAHGQQTQAMQGYVFNLKLTTPNASRDPDGIWEDSYFTPFGIPPRLPSIYTAELTTPAGKWKLSQLDSECTMQGVCSFVLTLTQSEGKAREMAMGGTLLGRSATLSLNYRKISTEEISENIKPFIGSYDVEPVK